MANDVKWIKITTDMFDNRKIRYLRKLPDGDSVVLIWVMLLTMAGRCNSGGMIFLTENIPYTVKMLADELDFEESTVQLAIKALEQLGMVDSSAEGFLYITGWEEHQSVDGMEKVREQNRIRKQRQRQRLLSFQELSRESHVTVTDSHATEIEEDIEIDIKEKRKEIEDDFSDVSTASGTDVSPKKKKYAEDTDAYQAASYLARQKVKHYPNLKPPSEEDIQRWAADFDKCNRIDGYSWDDIADVLRYSQKSKFWRQNIRSGAKFREQYERLLIQMTEEDKRSDKR